MELIDHVFVSHFLVTGTRTVEVTTVTAPQGLPSIEDDPNARIGKPGSDHAVVATFDLLTVVESGIPTGRPAPPGWSAGD